MAALDHALAYSRAGWPTFPLKPGGKVPATAHGCKDATTDPDRITRWWTDMPTANIGIATGSLLVVDLDHKETVNGWTEWLALVANLAPDQLEPDTWEVGTPTGGGHLYFRMPAVPVKNSASKVAPGIDVRGQGGYIVAPPSKVPAGRYTIESSEPVAALPNWLDTLLSPTARPPARRSPASDTASKPPPAHPATPRTALDAELDRVRSAATGTRNDLLCRAAFKLGQLVDRGDLERHAVTNELLDAANRVGLTETEALATIRSGFNGARDKPRAR